MQENSRIRKFSFSSLITSHCFYRRAEHVAATSRFHFPCDLQLLAGKLDYNDAGTPQARIVRGTARSWTFIKR